MTWLRAHLGSTLAKIRLTTVLFAVINTLLVSPPRTDLTVGVILLGIAVTLLLVANCVVTFVRQRVYWWEPLLIGPVLYGLALTMAAPIGIIGAALATVMSQSLYGSARSVAVRAVATVLVLAGVLVTPDQWLSGTPGAIPKPAVFAPAFFAFLLRTIYVMLQRQEEARAREALLAHTGQRLLGVTEAPDARAIVQETCDSLCAMTDGLELIVADGQQVIRAVHGLPRELLGRLVPVAGLAGHESTDIVTVHPADRETGPLHATLVQLVGERRGGWHLTGLGTGDEKRWLVIGGRARLPAGLLDVLRTLTTQLSLAEANCASIAELTQLAHHDPLTATPNRAAFFKLLTEALDQSAGREESMALLIIDLDDFKQINDTRGHAAGDQVLIEVAARMSELARGSGTASRFGGDEFALVLTGLGAREEADRFGARLRERLLEPIDLGEETVRIGASIGVVNAIAGKSAADLMRCADIAMYSAKARGKNRVERFTPDRHGDINLVRQLEEHLAHALNRKEIQVHYEPLVNLKTGHCQSIEAQPQWHHPNLGVILSDDFVPVAERHGQIIEIGHHILQTACRQLVQWSSDETASQLNLTVNVSIRQLASPGFDAMIEAALTDSGLAADRLVLGVRESETLHGDVPRSQLRTIADLGVRVTMDNFGGLLTSLAHLHAMPLDQLKIDRRLFTDAGTDLAGTSVHLIMSVSQFLRLETVAEGVETPEHADWARAVGITLAQGPLFARALSSQEFLPWLHAGRGSLRSSR